MKAFLIALLVSIGLTGCSISIDYQQEVVRDHLPTGVKNVRSMGNSWLTFELEVNGKNRKFLYRGNKLDRSNCATEAITELRD